MAKEKVGMRSMYDKLVVVGNLLKLHQLATTMRSSESRRPLPQTRTLDVYPADKDGTEEHLVDAVVCVHVAGCGEELCPGVFNQCLKSRAEASQPSDACYTGCGAM